MSRSRGSTASRLTMSVLKLMLHLRRVRSGRLLVDVSAPEAVREVHVRGGRCVGRQSWRLGRRLLRKAWRHPHAVVRAFGETRGLQNRKGGRWQLLHHVLGALREHARHVRCCGGGRQSTARSRRIRCSCRHSLGLVVHGPLPFACRRCSMTLVSFTTSNFTTMAWRHALDAIASVRASAHHRRLLAGRTWKGCGTIAHRLVGYTAHWSTARSGTAWCVPAHRRDRWLS